MKYTKIISSLILTGAFVVGFNADAADEAKKDKKKPAAGQSAKGKKGGSKKAAVKVPPQLWPSRYTLESLP